MRTRLIATAAVVVMLGFNAHAQQLQPLAPAPDFDKVAIKPVDLGNRTYMLAGEGGNITVGQAGNLVSVRTGGGQIDFGEVRGSVRAQTGGGGIRIMYVSGPMEVASSAGSICLTRVAGTVRAATAGGADPSWTRRRSRRRRARHGTSRRRARTRSARE